MLPSCGEKMSTTKAIMDTTGSLHVGCRPPSRVLRGKRAKCSAAAVDSCSSADANLAVRSSSCAGGGGAQFTIKHAAPIGVPLKLAKPSQQVRQGGVHQRIPCLPHMRRQVASEAWKPPSTRRHAQGSLACISAEGYNSVDWGHSPAPATRAPHGDAPPCLCTVPLRTPLPPRMNRAA